MGHPENQEQIQDKTESSLNNKLWKIRDETWNNIVENLGIDGKDIEERLKEFISKFGWKMKLFRDQEDIEKVLTNDNVVNVIWTKWSGKTTSSLKYIKDENYIVINCDRLLELPSDEEEDQELSAIRDMLKEKYWEIPRWKEFLKCYNDIVDYILNKGKKALIEWNIIQDLDPNSLKGKIIIKRTAVIKSFIRAIKRDFKNEYFMNLEKEKHKYLYKLTRLFKITNRRKNIFKQAKDIEKIIEELENI